MKWEQMFVAYSDCGRYKIEVKDVSPNEESDWDWTVYERDAVFDERWEYVSAAAEFLDEDEAKMQGRRELDRILAAT